MAKSLAVKYRPQKWSDVIGQDIIVKTLIQEINTSSTKNCYMFCGPSGDGKTTCARLLAKSINNNVGNPIEIDAASNNSVENVRSIVKSAQERSLDSKYKVFIVDECHALSNQAWQAFLKCIEEPPEFTVFIFCTTDVQKVPATILNRVERFNFNKISNIDILNRLRFICEEEKYINFEATIQYISKICGGGMRDAISLLEKCASNSIDLDITNSLKVLGSFPVEDMFKLLNAFIDDNEKEIFRIVDLYYNAGFDMKNYVEQLITFVLDVSKYCIFKDFSFLTIPDIFKEEMERTVSIDNASKYFLYVSDKLFTLKSDIRYDTNIKSTIEIAFMQIARCK